MRPKERTHDIPEGLVQVLFELERIVIANVAVALVPVPDGVDFGIQGDSCAAGVGRAESAGYAVSHAFVLID